MLIYFAGPLFSEAEKRFNEGLTQELEALGFRVFLPQRDGVERHKPPYDRMTPQERRVATFELDRDKILEADVFLFVLDGRVPDEGACVELGIAYSHKMIGAAAKLLVGLHTDARAAFPRAKLNLMLAVPLECVCQDRDDLLQVLTSYRASGTIGRVTSDTSRQRLQFPKP